MIEIKLEDYIKEKIDELMKPENEEMTIRISSQCVPAKVNKVIENLGWKYDGGRWDYNECVHRESFYQKIDTTLFCLYNIYDGFNRINWLYMNSVQIINGSIVQNGSRTDGRNHYAKTLEELDNE